MPRGDRTGPWGHGPMTGRAAGYCAGYPVPGFRNPIPRFGRRGGFSRGGRRGRSRGFSRGWGRRFGREWWSYPPPHYQQPNLPVPPHPYTYPPAYPLVTQPQTPEQEVAALEDYKKELEAERADLEQEMGEIESRIEELRVKLEQTEEKKQ